MNVSDRHSKVQAASSNRWQVSCHVWPDFLIFDGSDVAGLESERAAVSIRLQELTERVFLLAAASLVTSSETVQLIFSLESVQIRPRYAKCGRFITNLFLSETTFAKKGK